MGGRPLDLGASWIHGTRGNPVTDLAAAFGADTTATDYENLVLFDANGELVPFALIAEAYGTLERLLESAYEDSKGSDAAKSLGAALDGAAEIEELGEYDRQIHRWVLASLVEQDLAADAGQLSARAWYEGREYPGPDVLFPAGYGQVVDGLAEGLDIRLNHLVERIGYEGGVAVATSEGVVEGDLAVVTLPLGVLKAERVAFDPVLPVEKRTAIDRLEMGLLSKLYLEFEEVFWEPDVDLIGYVAPEGGAWGVWLNMHKYTGAPVLVGFNAGTTARALEARSDDEVVGEAVAALRAMYR